MQHYTNCYGWGGDDDAVGQQVALLSQLLHASPSFGPLPSAPSPSVGVDVGVGLPPTSGTRSVASFPTGYAALDQRAPLVAGGIEDHSTSIEIKRAQSMLAQLASLQLGGGGSGELSLDQLHQLTGGAGLTGQQQPHHHLLRSFSMPSQQTQHSAAQLFSGASFSGQQSVGWGADSFRQPSSQQHVALHGDGGPPLLSGRGNGGQRSRFGPLPPLATSSIAHQSPQMQHGHTGLQQRGWGGGGRKGSSGSRPGSRPGSARGSRSAMADSPVDELFLRVKLLKSVEPVTVAASPEMLRLFDSRGLAAVLKELAKSGAGARAAELFDWLASLPGGHELSHLADVYTYTATISNCVARQELDRAMRLVQQMRERGIERNVHTYSALMNVCIKCGRLQLALEVYNDMRAEGCAPNVVTYNTLVDVYGKCGMWEEALRVLDVMRSEGIDPVTRTYNTLMIACNTSGQWQQALRVFKAMSSAGFPANTTTYNALISAYSKAGNLAKVMETFHTMVQQGCERSVITYSSLISACEKAGECGLALRLFDDMLAEGCRPNVISYNSLITACAQGCQWDKAAEVFSQMQAQGCTPDVVTYTALIGAYEKGGQWRRALATFEQMRAAGCTPDPIVYNAIIDALWDTGVAPAQRTAAALFREAVQAGLVPLGRIVPLAQAALGPGSVTGGAVSGAIGAGCLGVLMGSSPGSSASGSGCGASGAGGGADAGRLVAGRGTDGAEGGSVGSAGAGSGSLDEGAAGVLAGGAYGGGNGTVVFGTGVGKAAELSLQAATPGMAMLSLEMWLRDLREIAAQEGLSALPEQVIIIYGRPKAAVKPEGRGGTSVRDAVVALLRNAGSPFEDPSTMALQSCGPGAANLSASTSCSELVAAAAAAAGGAGAGAGAATGGVSTGLGGGPGNGSLSPLSTLLSSASSSATSLCPPPTISINASAGLSTSPGPPAPVAATAFGATAGGSGCLRASGTAVGVWLLSGDRTQPVLPLFPGGCEPLPATGLGVRGPGSTAGSPATLSRSSSGSEATAAAGTPQARSASEQQAVDAFARVSFFESSHYLCLPSTEGAYFAQRPELLATALACAASCGLSVVVVCDALLLLDRLMSSAAPLLPADAPPSLMPLLLAACLAIAVRQVSPPSTATADPAGLPPSALELGNAMGLGPEVLSETQARVAEALGGDTSSPSAMHVLQLYCRYMGWVEQFSVADAMLPVGPPSPARLLLESLRDRAFLSCRPSLAAAAVLVAYRKTMGLLPYWPRGLADLTGFDLATTPDMATAVNSAIRTAERLLGNRVAPLSRMNSGVQAM